TITTDAGSFASGQPGVKVDGGNNVVVTNNTISSLDGAGIVVQNTWNDVESYDNTFTGNTITGAKFAGIAIWGGAYDNTFECNTITGTTELTFWAGQPWEETQADGVFLDDDAGTGNVFNYNNIYGNDGDGMENQVATTVDAEYNWWGDVSGPGGVGPGSGDEVSTNVDYDPWLVIANYTGGTLFSVVEDVMLEATFSDSNDDALPCGNVDFYVDGNLEGSATTNASGVASLNIGPLPVGVHDEVYAKTCCLQTNTVMLVIYDPSAGFVTGGGWIYSEPGADTDNPLAEGKANFGFVSKYNKKGATAPDGQTEFQFKAGDLNFHSTEYQWLVVTGSNFAKFKGVGAIDGEGDYKFQIWAGDNDPDTFRIKIWTEDSGGNENVRYDNGSDQAIDGGNIVVHTSKK
ncbi:right-handed parallel beta-helix repeat-containing protein, partial [Chloroflexota bacterium]